MQIKIHISFIKQIDGTTAANPKHVYINGGIHAREWISPATMIYIAYNVNQSYWYKSIISKNIGFNI